MRMASPAPPPPGAHLLLDPAGALSALPHLHSPCWNVRIFGTAGDRADPIVAARCAAHARGAARHRDVPSRVDRFRVGTLVAGRAGHADYPVAGTRLCPSYRASGPVADVPSSMLVLRRPVALFALRFKRLNTVVWCPWARSDRADPVPSPSQSSRRACLDSQPSSSLPCPGCRRARGSEVAVT